MPEPGRRPRPALLAALLLAPGLALGPAPGGAAAIDDYAYRAPLEGGSQALQRVDLPVEVLTGLTRADGADIAVFNADGQRLPLRLGRRPERVETRRIELELHAFENFVERSARQVTRRELDRNADGVSELTTIETIPVQSRQQRYLVDLGAGSDRRRFDRLELEWNQRPAGQLLELRLEVGDALGSLRTIDTPAVISDAANGGVEWRSIAGIDGRHRYLSLMPAADIDHFELRRVTGVYQARDAAPRLPLAVAPEVVDLDGVRYYRIDLPRAVRPAALGIRPAEASRMLVADLYAARGDEPRRLLQRRATQHSFDPGSAAAAAPIELPRGAYDRLWVSFAQAPERAPVFELWFEPWRLHFLGDGRPPYTLAWGNFEAPAAAGDLGALLGDSSAERLRAAAEATIGPVAVAGGDARLAPRPPLPWKKWLLWALLIGAALVTARMAMSLYRDMNAEPPPPGD